MITTGAGWQLSLCVQQAVSPYGQLQGRKPEMIGAVNVRHLNVLGVPDIGLQSLADALLRLVVLLLQLL